MAEDSYTFRITGAWRGDSDTGVGVLTGSGPDIALDYPVSLGGHDDKANPEELLLQAVAACYMLTLVAVAERRRVPVVAVAVEAFGDVVRQPGGTLKYTTIRLRPRISLSGADEAQLASARDLAHKADLYCPISNAIRGNVEVTIEPEIANS